MKSALQVVLELTLMAAVVAVVWADPAPVSTWFATASMDEQLLCASWTGDDEQFTHAMQRGASVGARDVCGSTPLHYAVTSGDAHLVRRLIALGADVNAANNENMTALTNAAVNDHADVVEILLRAGAQPTDETLDAATTAAAARAEAVLRRWQPDTGTDDP